MWALYRGDPKNDGDCIGYFDDEPEAMCAIHEDLRNHESGKNYYIIEADENEKDGES